MYIIISKSVPFIILFHCENCNCLERELTPQSLLVKTAQNNSVIKEEGGGGVGVS